MMKQRTINLHLYLDISCIGLNLNVGTLYLAFYFIIYRSCMTPNKVHNFMLAQTITSRKTEYKPKLLGSLYWNKSIGTTKISSFKVQRSTTTNIFIPNRIQKWGTDNCRILDIIPLYRTWFNF